MLKEAILKISALDHQGNTILATLQINKDAEIFIGHFAGQPVLPGACMLQMVKEVLQSALSISFRLQKASYIKFISLIDPRVHDCLQLRLTYQLAKDNIVEITADMIAQKAICFKFRGSFIIT
jgi:3-hydroxyacyl-[acyl-carrier-protein] dehydratase